MSSEYTKPEDVAREIWLHIEGGETALWIGSGLSEPSPYPNWKQLLRELCDMCGVDGFPDDSTPSSREFIRKAEECKQRNEATYHAVLKKIFGDAVVETRKAYTQLVKLPFNRFLTTNFDSLLSEAAEVEGMTGVHIYPDLPLNGGPSSVYYLHGHARGIEDDGTTHFVLSQSEFDHAYSNTLLKGFLEQVLTYERILFLGCSLREPSIEESFERVRKIQEEILSIRSQSDLPDRLILRPMLARETAIAGLLSEEDRDVERERDEEERYRELGIRVIRYQPLDDRHKGVEEVLDELRRITAGAPESTVGPGQDLPS